MPSVRPRQQLEPEQPAARPHTRPRQTFAELRALQRAVAAAIMRPLDAGWDTQTTWTDGRPTARVVEAFIKPNARLTSFERLQIYNRQYWFRLIDCLYDDFPGLLAVLGQERFDALIKAYLTEHPSRSFTLRNLGSRMPAFVEAESARTAPRQALALDMARFEWAQVAAFDGAAREPVAAADLLGADPAKLRLALQPHLSVLDLRYPLDDFALALKRHALRADASNAVSDRTRANRRAAKRPPLPRPRRTLLAVHRFDNGIYYKRLEPAAFALLAALRDGRTLAVACAAAIETGAMGRKDPAAEIRRWFKAWTGMGWFCRRERGTAGRGGRR